MSKKVIITAVPLRQRLCRITAVKEDGVVTQIQLAGKLGNPLADFLGLLLYI